MSETVDSILQRMLTRVKGLNPNANTSKGSSLYISMASEATEIWGLYKQNDWTLDQVFPDTASVTTREREAALYGISTASLTSAEVLTALFSRYRKPPSGGKIRDYERWAMEVSSAGKAATLSASMVTGTFTDLSADNLIHPHAGTTGFVVADGDVSKYLTIDLSTSQPIFGLGLGTYSSRESAFSVSSSDSLDGPWIAQGSVTLTNGWIQISFTEVSARYWRIALTSMDTLDSSITDVSLHTIAVYGIELYGSSSSTEAATKVKGHKNFYGVGTVGMVLEGDSLSKRFTEAVREHLEDEGPVAPKEIFVFPSATRTLSLRVAPTGSISSPLAFKTAVAQYFAGLGTGDPFIPAQVIVYAIINGATDASVSVSVDGGAYAVQTTSMLSTALQQFILGSVEIV